MKTFLQGLKRTDLLLLIGSVLGGVFSSPAFGYAIAPWIGISCSLAFLRKHPKWHAFLLLYLLGSIRGMIVEKDVIPMPLIGIVVLMLVVNLVGLIPYLLDAWLKPKFGDFWGYLIFPASFVVLDGFLAQGNQGTWGNIAYTQFDILPLMQMLSLTGLWGIAFLIYAFASWMADVINKGFRIHAFMLGYVIFASLVLIYGGVNLLQNQETKTVQVATISMDNLSIAKSMYQATYDSLPPLPERLQQNSPELAELMKGMQAFFADPHQVEYIIVFDEIDDLLNRYLEQSNMLAKQGAKLITWSEGAVMQIKENEEELKTKGSEFAKENEVYLFMPVAIFHPEKVSTEDRYIENKIWTFGPDGELLNEYFKNIPVFGVEPSFPGDGMIPVIETPYGRIAQAICYDLDFPGMMRQAGQQQADIIMVPTGDWEGIAPYHTYMGISRGIENGMGMVKAVSNGLSSISDPYGRILSQDSFFDGEEVHTLINDLPIAHKPTLYSRYGDWFLSLCQMMLFGMLLVQVFRFVRNKWKHYQLEMVNAGN